VSGLSLIALIAVAIVVFVVARDRFQSQPEPDDVDSVDYARIRVQTNFGLDEGLVVESLWAYCHATIDGTRLARPISRVDDGVFELVLEPSMGSQARRRFRGCVNDGTVDRAKTHLESLEKVARADAGM
jgi:hypothetical protein